MLYDHDLEIDRSVFENPIYHFTLDVDAEHIREMLDERGIQSDILAVDYAMRMVWERLMGDVEDVLDEVVEDMPTVWDDWDMLDAIRSTHVVYDEPEFWLALEIDPLAWQPPSLRTEGRASCANKAVADAVRANADKYPSFVVKDGEDGGVVIEWENFYFLNDILASVVERRFEEKFGEKKKVPALASEFSLPIKIDEWESVREELRDIAEDYDGDGLRFDLDNLKRAGMLDRGLMGELDELLGVLLTVDGLGDCVFHCEGKHIQALEDGSNIPAQIRAMANLEIGVPQYAPLDPEDPDIPF